tara:strand:- start:4712 stop:5815 length:1104 start_codon:yes stop_codon:yes gene_type:complete
MTVHLPYVGLRPYEKSEGSYFCGRRGEVSVLLDAYLEQAAEKGKLLIIYGPSAVGKTSMVQAGLWPIVRLEKDVARFERIVPTFEDDLASFSQRVRAIVGRMSGGASAERTLVFIDEIDQVFGYPLNGELEDETRLVLVKLLEFLVEASKRGIARILIGVSEPWSRFLEDAPTSQQFLANALDFFRLNHMSTSGMEEFLRLPVARWKKAPKDAVGVVDQTFFYDFYGEISANPASLPLANYTLERILETGDKTKAFDYVAYREMGGLLGAMLQYIEEVYYSWPEELQAKLPIFLELFRAASTENSEHDVRCAQVNPLVADPDAREVFGNLLHARILCLKGDRWNNAEAQLAHDRLFEKWPRSTVGAY